MNYEILIEECFVARLHNSDMILNYNNDIKL